jgi:Phage tail assembly chaperone protein, TAC
MQDILKHTVDNDEYEFYFIAPEKALPLGAKIAKMIIGPIGSAFGDGAGLAGAIDSNINLAAAFKDLSSIDEKEFTKIVMELLGSVRLGTGMAINVNIHFEGRLMHMINVATKAMEVNYKDFFDALKERFGGLVRRVVPNHTSQGGSTSSGSSGGSSSQGSQRSKK